ncbi:MAG: alpha/beta hydrolase [Planctomycetota bacterium]
MIAMVLFSLVSAASAQPLPIRSSAGPDDPPAPEDVKIGGDARKRYLVHGGGKDAKAVASGWKVLVVMPGGDGSAEFAPFVGRIRENALGDDWLVVQIVAPVWEKEQAEKLVWPTKLNPWPKIDFTCEELFAAVLEDVGKTHKLDPKYLFTLAWSSSGSLAYTLGLQEKTPVTGTFVAMSVFKPENLPSLKEARGRSFYILHSSEDFIPIKMAEDARDQLTKKGAKVEYATYAGGHGWHGDVFGTIGKGIGWLEKQAKSPGARPAKSSKSGSTK